MVQVVVDSDSRLSDIRRRRTCRGCKKEKEEEEEEEEMERLLYINILCG